MSNITFSDSIIDVSGEEELLPGTYFTVKNGNDLMWEGFAHSKEQVQERFPNGAVSEWEPTEFVGVWMF